MAVLILLVLGLILASVVVGFVHKQRELSQPAIIQVPDYHFSPTKQQAVPRHHKGPVFYLLH